MDVFISGNRTTLECMKSEWFVVGCLYQIVVLSGALEAVRNANLLLETCFVGKNFLVCALLFGCWTSPSCRIPCLVQHFHVESGLWVSLVPHQNPPERQILAYWVPYFCDVGSCWAVWFWGKLELVLDRQLKNQIVALLETFFQIATFCGFFMLPFLLEKTCWNWLPGFEGLVEKGYFCQQAAHLA